MAQSDDQRPAEAARDSCAQLRMSGGDAGYGAGQMTAQPSRTGAERNPTYLVFAQLTNSRMNHVRFHSSEASSR